ncbi:hypothetical protein EVAR_57117_1 [Eumeta japonica]|uniref:Uncharacterized protein n=1 Tax=Eumeta variegata TaxID=151549 RepID=A0A4C1YP79_EUMVA|nr:hypothetical protein EVAR_57117_1 [Eumeta japonica]
MSFTICVCLPVQTPEYMRLAPNVCNHSKAIIPYKSETSPAATRMREHPRLAPPPASACLETGAGDSCIKEDVDFACPRSELHPPCCNFELSQNTAKHG